MAEAGALAIIKKAQADGIRFIQLQFTDVLGIVKAVTIPIHQLESSVKHGTWFDGSSIEGFTRIAESDQYLMPDMSTFAEMNAAWDAWVDLQNLPARATVEARLASPDYKVEIAGIAAA